ncbi:hypothetical protein [Vreelandella sedimenti]|uniref:hypothetical protein n=1 Tax=Vreelandella sedimenti TaxID=2729618 RepID=UPI00074A004A|nr:MULTISPECIES: hypothetical protein [unclassified Halomonas]KUJ87157.1 MAG: hypothetical protein XD36_2441 [Halomonas sp. 54_146]HAA44146.1 hypothetical protein [Halomonas sp.]|tara:strand:+ start:13776 stop:14075 length:300 start_codon:yes stop_codon:yes gene_type:complete
MTRPITGFDMRCNDLRDSASAIRTIMRLIEEDQMRRDTDDETPFLTPGLTCGLSSAATQLTERIHSLTDALSLEYGEEVKAASEAKLAPSLQAVKRNKQ